MATKGARRPPVPAGRRESPHFPGIEDAVAVGRLRGRTLFAPHLHDAETFEIIYVDTGLRCYTIDGRRHLVAGGEVLVVKPGDLHGIAWPCMPARVYYMKLRVPRSGEAFLNLRGAPARSLIGLLRGLSPRQFLGSPGIKPCLERLGAYRRRKVIGTAAPAMVAMLVLEFLREVADCAERQRKRRGPSGWAAEALNYLGERLSPAPRVREVAEHMGMSIPGFKARFKRELGVTPISYVQHLRIDRARELLAGDPGRSITDVAVELGFSSSQLFATVFKRLCGETPGAFRGRQMRAARP